MVSFINYAISATRGVLPSFYIFKGERLRDDYIKLSKPNIYMAMQKKNMDNYFLV
jgi:hypothetical protein